MSSTPSVSYYKTFGEAKIATQNVLYTIQREYETIFHQFYVIYKTII